MGKVGGGEGMPEFMLFIFAMASIVFAVAGIVEGDRLTQIGMIIYLTVFTLLMAFARREFEE